MRTHKDGVRHVGWIVICCVCSGLRRNLYALTGRKNQPNTPTRNQIALPSKRADSVIIHCQNEMIMKKIEAIIRLSRFEKVRDALASIGVNFFTLQDVKGYGLQKGEKKVYRGSVYDADYIARLQIDILANPEMVEPIIQAILSAGRTGEVGDGKIVVLDVEQVVRIRTSETGSAAI